MGWFRNYRTGQKIQRLREANQRLSSDLFVFDQYGYFLTESEQVRLKKKINNDIHRIFDLGGDPARAMKSQHDAFFVKARDERKEYPVSVEVRR